MLKLFLLCAAAGGALAMAAGAPGDAQPPQNPEGGPAPQYSAELKVGDKAPDFALPGSDGKTHRLSDYTGRTVVLAWFPKAFTGG